MRLQFKFIILYTATIVFTGCAETPKPALENTPPAVSDDYIVVEKKARVMKVYHGAKLVKTYKVSLGFDPVGHKEKEGDGKTPEGIYKISFKKPSKYHRALKVSYPNHIDSKQAKKKGVKPGGDIMIHGLGAKFRHIGSKHLEHNWTKGCIAVTDQEIQELYERIEPGTRIEIKA